MLDFARIFYCAIIFFILSVCSGLGSWYAYTLVNQQQDIQTEATFEYYDLLLAVNKLEVKLEQNIRPENIIPAQQSVAVFRKLSEQFEQFSVDKKHLLMHLGKHKLIETFEQSSLIATMQVLTTKYETILDSIEESASSSSELANQFALLYQDKRSVLFDLKQLERWLLTLASQSQAKLSESLIKQNSQSYHIWMFLLIGSFLAVSMLLGTMIVRRLKYLSGFFHSYPNPLFTFDINGMLLNCNQPFKDISYQFMFNPLESHSVCEFLGHEWHAIHWHFKDCIENNPNFPRFHHFFTGKKNTRHNNNQYFHVPLTVKGKQNETFHYRIEVICIRLWLQPKAVCRLIDHSEIMNLKQSTELDPFTLLLNKPNMLYRLGQEIERAKRQHIPLSVLFFDIDEFKQINDANGHAFGDKVLKWVAQTIKQRVRDTDVIGRFGGDEFVVVCPDCSEEQANNIANTVQHLLNDHEFPVFVSIGITEMELNDDVDTLMERADQALYHCKRNGKNSVSLASEINA